MLPNFRFSSLLRTLVLALSATAPLGIAAADEGICGIDRVVAEKNQVRVYFLPGVNFFAESKLLGRFDVKDGTVRWPSGKTDTGLLLSKGQDAMLIFGVESSCFIGFAEDNGHLGISARASDTLPNLPHQAVNRFIAAQSD